MTFAMAFLKSDPTTSLLGEVEMLVLLAVLRLGDDAYAVPIRELVLADAGVELSRGTIYVALERLERRGYVTSYFSDPQAVRGGKARRMFQLKPAGLAALKTAKSAVDRLASGTVLSKVPKG
jgi:DNA-binding PadR family transcriptional regulator